jgi:DNA-binding IclR family transcriptional regulator
VRKIEPHESHRQIAKLMAELIKGQGTRYELSNRTGLHRNYISRILAALKEQGCVYVIGWNKDTTGRYAQEVFTLGFGQDVPRPPRQTQRERDAKRYRKMKEKRMMESSMPIRTQFVGGSLWQ